MWPSVSLSKEPLQYPRLLIIFSSGCEVGACVSIRNIKDWVKHEYKYSPHFLHTSVVREERVKQGRGTDLGRWWAACLHLFLYSGFTKKHNCIECWYKFIWASEVKFSKERLSTCLFIKKPSKLWLNVLKMSTARRKPCWTELLLLEGPRGLGYYCQIAPSAEGHCSLLWPSAPLACGHPPFSRLSYEVEYCQKPDAVRSFFPHGSWIMSSNSLNLFSSIK